MTDLTDAEQRTLAWQTLPCRTTSCLQPAGRRCITSSGERTSPHAPRIYDIRAYLLGQATAQAENAALTAQVASLKASYEQVTAALSVSDDKLEVAAEVNSVLTAELKTANARITVLETPPVVVPSSNVLPFGIGVNEKITAAPGVPTVYTLARLEQEAGVKFTYVHEYFTFGTSGVLASVVTWCETHLKAGRTPLPTIKLPGNDWAGAAAGKYDGTVKATADALEALSAKYGLPVVVITHHEPTGDGDRDTFLAMYAHLRPIIQRPGHVQYWMNLEGWAQILDPTEKVWNLENLKVDGIDGYLFDPYLAFWQLKNNSTKFTDMVKVYLTPLAAWCKANGFQVGIAETGMTAVAQAKTGVPNDTWWTDFTDGALALGYGPVIYWNNYNPSSGNDWRISTIKPANMLGQMVAAMKAHAPA